MAIYFVGNQAWVTWHPTPDFSGAPVRSYTVTPCNWKGSEESCKFEAALAVTIFGGNIQSGRLRALARPKWHTIQLFGHRQQRSRGEYTLGAVAASQSDGGTPTTSERTDQGLGYIGCRGSEATVVPPSKRFLR